MKRRWVVPVVWFGPVVLLIVATAWSAFDIDNRFPVVLILQAVCIVSAVIARSLAR